MNKEENNESNSNFASNDLWAWMTNCLVYICIWLCSKWKACSLGTCTLGYAPYALAWQVRIAECNRVPSWKTSGLAIQPRWIVRELPLSYFWEDWLKTWFWLLVSYCLSFVIDVFIVTVTTDCWILNNWKTESWLLKVCHHRVRVEKLLLTTEFWLINSNCWVSTIIRERKNWLWF